jgi:hypothetical protein
MRKLTDRPADRKVRGLIAFIGKSDVVLNQKITDFQLSVCAGWFGAVVMGIGEGRTSFGSRSR